MKIVQIGTCVGNDDLTNIIDTIEPEILILVEPMEIHNKKIKECYGHKKNVFLENIAISNSDDSEMSFYYHKNDGPKFEVATTDVNHIIKHGYTLEGIIELKVKCLTINDLFDKYNLLDIDVLFIDAEGLDDQIIKSINFSKYNISKIYFENLHLKDFGVYDFLKSMGYSIIKKTGYMGWSSVAEKKLTI